MTVRKDRVSSAVTAATVLLLSGLVGATALGIRASNATKRIDERFTTADASAQQGVKSDGDRTGSHRQVESASDSTFDEQVLQSSVPVLVDFYADWCGPCQVQGRILEEFAPELRGAKIVKVNVDENDELAQRFHVEGIPTVLIIKNGQVIGRHEGVTTKEQLKSALAG